jgi:hypothetical protein
VGLNPDLTTLKSAIEIALESGARVTALHVVNPAAHLPGQADRTFCATLRTYEALGRTVVDRSRRALDEAQCPGDAQMRMLPFGDVTVGQVIADAADELGADLVVVGSNDPGWFLLYLQNMQKDVVRRCRTRVLVITPACLPRRGTQRTLTSPDGNQPNPERRARSMPMQRVEKLGQTQPENLHTDAEDRESEEPHGDLCARWAEQPRDMGGETHAQIDADAHQRQGHADTDEMNRLQTCSRRTGAKRNRNGDRTRADRYRHGQWIKRFAAQRVLAGTERLWPRRLATLVIRRL